MLDRALLDRLDVAVTEAAFVGLTFDVVDATAVASLDVLSLPAEGPVDADRRRLVRFGGVTTVEASRRVDDAWAAVSPLLPLESLTELGERIASARFTDTHGGFHHFDIDDPAPHVLAHPGLRLGRGPARSGHSWYWGLDLVEADGARTMLHGGVWFTDLAVERSDGTAIPVEQFADDGYRWWTAMRAGDPRLTVEAQQAAGSSGVIVPG